MVICGEKGGVRDAEILESRLESCGMGQRGEGFGGKVVGYCCECLVRVRIEL